MISAFIDVLVIPLLNYCTRFLPTVPILCIHLVQLHNLAAVAYFEHELSQQGELIWGGDLKFHLDAVL